MAIASATHMNNKAQVSALHLKNRGAAVAAEPFVQCCMFLEEDRGRSTAAGAQRKKVVSHTYRNNGSHGFCRKFIASQGS